MRGGLGFWGFSGSGFIGFTVQLGFVGFRVQEFRALDRVFVRLGKRRSRDSHPP